MRATVIGGEVTRLKPSGNCSPNNPRKATDRHLVSSFLRFGAVVVTVAASVAAIVLSNATPASAGPTTVHFSYTDAVQTWTVPAGVTSVEVDVRAAQGGGTYGGLGARVVSVIAVVPGQTVYIYVGGQPTSWGATGFDGGANGGGSGTGAGGDATDVRLGGTALADRVVVAGGGGGQGTGADAVDGPGGSGGSFNAAQAGTPGDCSGSGGGGGTNSAGGSAGSGVHNGTAGSLGIGGNGSGYIPLAGGGGGGYYGGGGGAGCYNFAGGGGGGSDFVEATATSVQDFAGYNAGSGSVTVTYPPSSPSSSPSSGTKDFSYTGTPQLWTVPAGVTSVQVDVRGAQGGGTYGGFGSRVEANVPVIPGQVMVVDVGGQPTSWGATGFDGGANGGGSGTGAGGDATDVRLGGTALADRVVVAGGGGGQGTGADAVDGPGGSGGSFNAAQAGTPGDCSGSGGGGGTNSAGGSAGSGVHNGTAGSLGIGGNGSGYIPLAGGGGGGYYGGGGGAGCYNFAGGGGGGSDFVEATATSVQDFAGYNAGSGSVTVTYPPSSPSSSPSSGTKDFSYTGTPQLWTVPAGVTSVQVDVRGAQGGGTYGGFGSRVEANVPVIPGQVMVVDVGGQPTSWGATGFDGGANGGGSGTGGVATPPTCASAVRRWPTGSWWPAVVAARGRGPTRSTALGARVARSTPPKRALPATVRAQVAAVGPTVPEEAQVLVCITARRGRSASVAMAVATSPWPVAVVAATTAAVAAPVATTSPAVVAVAQTLSRPRPPRCRTSPATTPAVAR